MAKPQRTAVQVVGAIFLLLGIVQFLRGENWIVWMILGVLFGGLSLLRGAKTPDGPQ